MTADLFTDQPGYQPLAALIRPRKLADFFGQSDVIGEGSPLRQALESGNPHSMIFWGPPGVGKTTFGQDGCRIRRLRIYDSVGGDLGDQGCS